MHSAALNPCSIRYFTHPRPRKIEFPAFMCCLKEDSQYDAGLGINFVVRVAEILNKKPAAAAAHTSRYAYNAPLFCAARSQVVEFVAFSGDAL